MHNAKKIAGLLMMMVSIFLLLGGLYLTAEMVSQLVITLLIVGGLLLLIAEGLFMYLTLDQIRTFLEVLKTNFPDGGILIAEQNCKAMQKNEKHHDTVKNTKAHFMSGTDSGQEIADLTSGFQLVEEHSFNEEMKKYSIRGKLFALLLPKMNDRWATFRW